MASLDEVLSDKPVAKAEAPQAPQAETKEPAPLAEPDKGLATDGQPKYQNLRREHRKKEWTAQGRDPDTGQFVTKEKEPEPKAEPKAEAKPAPEAPKPEAKPAEPPKPPEQEMTGKERAAFAAAADERRKRQELERRLAELERTQKPPEQPKKAFWDDPDAALKGNEQLVREVQVQTRLQTSEMLARSKYTDFDDKITIFQQLLQANPGLGPQWINQLDPAEFAYTTAKNHQQMQQAGGLDGLRKQIEEETAKRVRAEMEAEYKKREEEAARQRAALPGSLSDVRGGSGQKATPVWGGPTSLGDILKH